MKYAAKKIVWMLLTMVIVSFLAFLAFRIIPGDPTAKLLGEQATPEWGISSGGTWARRTITVCR